MKRLAVLLAAAMALVLVRWPMRSGQQCDHQRKETEYNLQRRWKGFAFKSGSHFRVTSGDSCHHFRRFNFARIIARRITEQKQQIGPGEGGVSLNFGSRWLSVTSSPPTSKIETSINKEWYCQLGSFVGALTAHSNP